MTEYRLEDYLLQIRESATDARSFVEGLTEKQFLADKRTQQAVTMSLLIIGEVVTKIMEQHPRVR